MKKGFDLEVTKEAYEEAQNRVWKAMELDPTKSILHHLTLAYLLAIHDSYEVHKYLKDDLIK